MASVWALWIVAAQTFLWTPLLRSLINVHAPKVRLEYRYAWSVVPGVVHVRGFVLTGQDRSVEWRLAIDQARTFIPVGQLASRIFHAQHVRAHGVAFALRRRLRPAEVTPERVRGLPLIPGLPDLPRREEGPDDNLPDFRYRLFTVWLEDVTADQVRQIWIDGWRMDGTAELAGAFYLKPVRDVLVAPGELRVERASVNGLLHPVADGVQGTLRVSIGPFDPRGITLQRFFGTVDVDADLRGRIAGLEALGARGGRGPAEMRAQVRRGRLESGGVTADLDRLSWRGVIADHARVRGDATPRVSIEAALTRARMPQVASRAESIRTVLSGETFDFGRPRLPDHAEIDVAGGAIADVRQLGVRLFRDRRVETGHGAFAAHLEGPLHRLAGSARLSLRGVRVAAKGVKVRGDARIAARIRSLDPGAGADLTGTQVAIDHGRLVPELDIGPGWWGRARLRNARIRFHPLRLDADLDARCRDARPIVGVYARAAGLPDFLNSLFGMDNLIVYGSAHAGRGWLSVPEITAEGNDASVRATLREDDAGRRGAALLTAHGISVALDLNGGGSSLHIFGPGDFFADRQNEVRAQPMGRRAPRRPR